MEKVVMRTYAQTADSSGFYRDRAGVVVHWTPGAADSGTTVDVTKNNVVPACVVYESGSFQPVTRDYQVNRIAPGAVFKG